MNNKKKFTPEELKARIKERGRLAYLINKNSPTYHQKVRDRQRKWYKENKHTPEYKLIRSQKQRQKYVKRPFWRILKTLKRFDKVCNLTRFDLWRIVKRQKMICPLTGRRLTNETMSPDHIIPVSKGGLATLENIRFVVMDANKARQALTDHEFFLLCKEVYLNGKSKFEAQ